MANLSGVVGPVLFRGGPETDYDVVVGQDKSLATRHIHSGETIPHVVMTEASSEINLNISIDELQLVSEENSKFGCPVNLLNLAINSWSLWKIYDIKRKIVNVDSTMQDVDKKINMVGEKVNSIASFLERSVSHLSELIQNNTRMMAMLLDGQQDIASRFDKVFQELIDLREFINSKRALEQAQQLEKEMLTLLQYYEICTHEMQAGRQPPTKDLRRVIDTSTEFIANLDTRLGAMPVEAPERFPYLVARAFALCLQLNARELTNEAPMFRLKALTNFRKMLCYDLDAITGKTTLFSLAVEKRSIVEHYIYLIRVIGVPTTLVELTDGQFVPLFPQKMLNWDDGLNRVRELIDSQDVSGPPQSFELRELDEHEAWQALSGLPIDATGNKVEWADLACTLGLPADTILSEDAIRELLLLALPVKEKVVSRIRQECGCDG